MQSSKFKLQSVKYFATSLMILLVISACSMISPFNQRAYEQATELKVDALSLMDKAVRPFSEYRSEVDLFRLNIEKAYEYAKGLPKNNFTAKQWEILKDPNRRLLGGFLKRWEEKSKLSEVFIQEAKTQVTEGFDTIIELESGKRKPEEVSNR